MSFDALLKAIPEYIYELLRLISGPRQFFTGRDLNGKKDLLQALSFLFKSSIISFVLRVPFLGDPQAYWQAAIFTVILYTPTAVVLGVVAFGCCRLVGGRGALLGHVTIFSYIAGFSVLIFALFSLVAKGIIIVEMPDQFELYQKYMRAHFPDIAGLDAGFATLLDSRELLISMLVLGIGFLLITGWFVWAWRAFGDWNNVAGLRTAAALVLFLLIGYGINAGLTLAQIGAGVSLF